MIESSNEPDRGKLFDYLLDKLPEEERDLLEEHIFSDGKRVFEQVAIAEDELIDLYLVGRLTPGDRQRMEVFLAKGGEGRRRRVAFARAFRTYVNQENAAVAVPASGGAAGWLQLLRTFFIGPRLAIMVGVGAAFILGAVSDSIWHQWSGLNGTSEASRTVHQQQPTPEARKPEQEAPPQLVAKAELPPASVGATVWNLQSVPTRSDSGIDSKPLLRLPEANVRMRLPLDTNDFTNFAVSIETPEGRTAWRGKPVRESKNQLEALVPVRALQPGRAYIVHLTGIPSGGQKRESAADYELRIAPE